MDTDGLPRVVGPSSGFGLESAVLLTLAVLGATPCLDQVPLRCEMGTIPPWVFAFVPAFAHFYRKQERPD